MEELKIEIETIAYNACYGDAQANETEAAILHLIKEREEKVVKKLEEMKTRGEFNYPYYDVSKEETFQKTMTDAISAIREAEE